MEFDGNRGYVALRKNIYATMLTNWVQEENERIKQQNQSG